MPPQTTTFRTKMRPPKLFRVFKGIYACAKNAGIAFLTLALSFNDTIMILPPNLFMFVTFVSPRFPEDLIQRADGVCRSSVGCMQPHQ